jgi:hypothetical protein
MPKKSKSPKKLIKSPKKLAKSPQKLITDYLSKETKENVKKKEIAVDKKIFGYNPDTDCWHCMICGENMGKTNSRQLCGKSFCYNDYNNYND